MSTWERYGVGLYMFLLHANFLAEPETEQQQFVWRLLGAATGVSERELQYWLRSGSWREMLVAAWIVGLMNARQFHDSMRERLLSSSTCFAGPGCCFAMACFQSSDAADALCEYLKRYLPVGSREYDQEWAIGALAWLDDRLGSTRTRTFTEDPHLWIVTGGGRQVGSLDPSRGIDQMREIMSFLAEYGVFDGLDVEGKTL